MNSYAAATSGQVNNRWLARPPASLHVGFVSGSRPHAPSQFFIGAVVALPDRARVVVVTDTKHLLEVILRFIPFLTGIRAKRFPLGIGVKLLPGSRFVFRAVEGEKQALSSILSLAFYTHCASVAPRTGAPASGGRRA